MFVSGRLIATAGFMTLLLAGPAAAEGIAYKIVNSPLAPAGTVRDAHTGINILLQSDQHQGPTFMSPEVVGYGISPGGRIEIEMLDGFERDRSVKIAQKVIMVLSGTPHQPMPGKAVGYAVSEGSNPKTIVIRSTKPAGLQAETLMSPVPGAKGDPIRQRGIKVFHIGLLEYPFVNRGTKGTIEVRFLDRAGRVLHAGRQVLSFLDTPVPQIQPSNMPDAQRSHNWQSAKRGDVLGVTGGSLPISYSVYGTPKGVPQSEMKSFKGGLLGVGVLSTQQLAAMEYKLPPEIARYTGGLIVQDGNADGRLDPKADKIIGGVIGAAPAGAKGQELRSLNVHGATDLTRPLAAYHAKFGKLFGGAVGLLQFTVGDKPGLYKPTLALLSNPDDLAGGDGSSYTFTIVAK